MLALAHVIMTVALPVRLRVLVPAVENAIAGNAYRPGDVLHTRAKITVENGNTGAARAMNFLSTHRHWCMLLLLLLPLLALWPSPTTCATSHLHSHP